MRDREISQVFFDGNGAPFPREELVVLNAMFSYAFAGQSIVELDASVVIERLVDYMESSTEPRDVDLGKKLRELHLATDK